MADPSGRRPDRMADIVIVGAGAAGLFAAAWAGRTARAAGVPLSISAVDGARKLGAKILVAGGGRCNVTHWRVTEADFAGSTPPAIRKVLGRFTADDALAFFSAAGVPLKREETGKLFPVSDSAKTVLAALVREATHAGATLEHPSRVVEIARDGAGFLVFTDTGTIGATRVILCTGGKSLPKSGSDGAGLAIAASLGHSLTEPIVPALVPLTLPQGHWITELSGLTLPAEAVLLSGTGRRLRSSTGSTLCTHFGLSGPGILDISRHWLVAAHHARAAGEPPVRLALNWLPGLSADGLERLLLDAPGRGASGRGAVAVLRDRMPERHARRLCEGAGAAAAGWFVRGMALVSPEATEGATGVAGSTGEAVFVTVSGDGVAAITGVGAVTATGVGAGVFTGMATATGAGVLRGMAGRTGCSFTAMARATAGSPAGSAALTAGATAMALATFGSGVAIDSSSAILLILSPSPGLPPLASFPPESSAIWSRESMGRPTSGMASRVAKTP